MSFTINVICFSKLVITVIVPFNRKLQSLMVRFLVRYYEYPTKLETWMPLKKIKNFFVSSIYKHEKLKNYLSGFIIAGSLIDHIDTWISLASGLFNFCLNWYFLKKIKTLNPNLDGLFRGSFFVFFRGSAKITPPPPT